MNLIAAYIVFVAGIAVPETGANKDDVVRRLSEYVTTYFVYRGMSYESDIPEFIPSESADAATNDCQKANRNQAFATQTDELEVEKAMNWARVEAVKNESDWPKDYCTGSIRVDDFSEASQFCQIYWDNKDKNNPEAEKEALPVIGVKIIKEFPPVLSEKVMEQIIKVAKIAYARNVSCEVDQIWYSWKGFKSISDVHDTATPKYIYFIMTQAEKEKSEKKPDGWRKAEELDNAIERSDECSQHSSK